MRMTNPERRLSNARRAYRIAQEACPHWDYESDAQGIGFPAENGCCTALFDAGQELKNAKRAAHEERS